MSCDDVAALGTCTLCSICTRERERARASARASSCKHMMQMQVNQGAPLRRAQATSLCVHTPGAASGHNTLGGEAFGSTAGSSVMHGCAVVRSSAVAQGRSSAHTAKRRQNLYTNSTAPAASGAEPERGMGRGGGKGERERTAERPGGNGRGPGAESQPGAGED